MKTPAEIADSLVTPERYAQISTPADLRRLLAAAIEADQWQRQGRLDDLHAYDHHPHDEDTPCDRSDAILIVQIDTAESIGRMRVYVNDGRIYDGDPETGDEWSLL